MNRVLKTECSDHFPKFEPSTQNQLVNIISLNMN